VPAAFGRRQAAFGSSFVSALGVRGTVTVLRAEVAVSAAAEGAERFGDARGRFGGSAGGRLAASRKSALRRWRKARRGVFANLDPRFWSWRESGATVRFGALRRKGRAGVVFTGSFNVRRVATPETANGCVRGAKL
jgi:hypothetical protein